MTAPWAPTHRAPASGLDTWPTPDPAAAPGARLDGGLQVMVVVTQAHGWTRVRCSNDWEAWVDGRWLEPLAAPVGPATQTMPMPASSPVPMPAPAPVSMPAPGHGDAASAPVGPAGRTRGLVIGGVVALAAVVLVAVLVLRKPSPDTIAATASTASTVTPVAGQAKLSTPSGWAASPDGHTVAADPADLTAAEPAGPRVRVVPDDNTSFEDAYDKAFDAGAAVVPLGPPSTMLINGRNAVVITLTETTNGSKPVTRRYIATSDAAGNSVEFVLEAPADSWAANERTLLDVPSLG